MRVKGIPESEWLGIEDYMLETYPPHGRERVTIDAARLIARAVIAAALILRPDPFAPEGDDAA